jgi:serine/threonine-protein kinase
MSSDAAVIGSRISRYLVLDQVGSGGMGVIYRARDEHLGREVALKVLHAGSLADEAARKRFRREALALSSLNHPGISTVFDFDTQDGTDYLVLEFVEGESLEARLKRGALEEKETADFGAQIADALAAAHERGVVHRDLKPGNVIVTPRGRVKLLDFGLALLSGAAAPTPETKSITEMGRVVGTLSYMSPEQLLGREIDERSDLYSLGVLLFEMATGSRPFDAPVSTALVNEILHRPAPRPGTRGRPLRSELETLIQGLLEKNPDRRPQSATAVHVALLDVTRGLSAAAVATGTPPRGLAAPSSSTADIAAPAPPAPRGAGATVDSIAVLPLGNLSHDPEQEYFADGMTEALITNLAQIQALRVVSRTSAMRFKGVRKPLPEIARELGVAAIVEGTVARSGQRVRITAQLIEAATDRHLWARSYERDLSDALALQADVARAIADEVQVYLTPVERERLSWARRVDPEALEAYLRGRHHWNRRTETAIRRGIEYFQEAIRLDPVYAQAYAGLAIAYDSMGSYNYLPPGEAYAKSLAAVRQALEIDDTLAEAHTAHAGLLFSWNWDWPAAEAAYKKAISLNPNYAGAHHWYADMLSALGRHDEAIESIRRAYEIDPLSLPVNMTLGTTLFYARRYDEAVERQLRTIELDPSFAPVFRNLGGSYEQMGRFEEAAAAYEKSAAMSPDLTALALEAHLFAVSGRKDEAKRLLAKLEVEGKGRYLPRYSVAAVYAGLGEHDAAFENLERAYEMRDRGMVWIKVSPRLDPLRPDPRFSDLLRRMKLA